MQNDLFGFLEEAPTLETAEKEATTVQNQEKATSFNPEIELIGDYAFHAPIDQRIDGSIEAIKEAYRQQKKCMLLCSFGKDSSLTAQLSVIALKEVIAEGVEGVELHIATSTVGGAESVLMTNFVEPSVEKVKQFAKDTGLPIFMHTVAPKVAENYLVSVLKLRSAISWPGQDKTCSQDMKRKPLKRLSESLVKELGGQFVHLFGMYYRESDERFQSMSERGNRPDKVVSLPIMDKKLIKKNGKAVLDSDGKKQYKETFVRDELSLCPIASFTTADVLKLCHGRLCNPIAIQLGSRTLTQEDLIIDFNEVSRIYTDAASTSCSTEAMYRGDSAKTDTGCSARTGCWACTKVGRDKSAENIAKNSGDKATTLLLSIRNVLKAKQFDIYSRQWLFRTANSDNKVKIEAAQMSHGFAKSLLQWIFTVEVETGHQVLRPIEIMHIAFDWCRYGYNGLEVFSILEDVQLGARYYPTKEDMRKHSRVEYKKMSMLVEHFSEEYIDSQRGLEESELSKLINALTSFNSGNNAVEKVKVDGKWKYSDDDSFIIKYNYLSDQLGYEGKDLMRLAKSGSGNQVAFQQLDVFEQNAVIEAEAHAQSVAKARWMAQDETNQAIDDQYWGVSEERINSDMLDVLAFRLHELADDFRHYPDMKPSDAFHRMHEVYGINPFASKQSFDKSDKMLKRADALHESGISAVAHDPREVLKLLTKDQDAKLDFDFDSQDDLFAGIDFEEEDTLVTDESYDKTREEILAEVNGDEVYFDEEDFLDDDNDLEVPDWFNDEPVPASNNALSEIAVEIR